MCNHSAETFLCPRQSGGLLLLPSACAKLWQRGLTADATNAARLCRGCTIGAEHAGAGSQAAPAVPAGHVCVRCGRSNLRIIASTGICVSCYNREREVRIGRNRRGQPPCRAVPLAPLLLVVDGRPVARSAASLVEAALWAASRAPGALISRGVSAHG